MNCTKCSEKLSSWRFLFSREPEVRCAHCGQRYAVQGVWRFLLVPQLFLFVLPYSTISAHPLVALPALLLFMAFAYGLAHRLFIQLEPR